LFNFRRQEFHHIVLGLWEMKAILETHLESIVIFAYIGFKLHAHMMDVMQRCTGIAKGIGLP